MSTYDEELYTTKRVSEHQLSKDQVKRAIEIEKELAKKERADSIEDKEEDEEKMFGAVLGTGRYLLEKSEEVVPMRERAISMGSYGEFTKDGYKKTREHLMNPHKGKKEEIGIQIDSLDALDLNIAQTANEEVIMNFIKFKQEKQPSRDSILKNFKEFSSKINSKICKLETIEEEKMHSLPTSVIEVYLESWRNIIRDNGFQEW